MNNQNKIKKSRLTLKGRESLIGRLFVLPFYIGFIVFSVAPLIETMKMMFHNVKIDFGGFAMEYVGLKNFNQVFAVDPDFLFNLSTSVGNMLWQVPAILFVSLFLAILINTKFRGRAFVRVVFFLPVIVMTGAVILIIQNDVVANAAMSGEVVAGGKIEYNVGLEQLLVDAGLNTKVVETFTKFSNDVFNLAWKTGVQIIIFLSGLQSIPSSLYEASSVEGATKWEEFFKITLPMLLPVFVLNTVYTIVDSFTDSGNKAMNQVLEGVTTLNFGPASVMSYSYFVLIAIFVLIIMFVFSKLSKRYSA